MAPSNHRRDLNLFSHRVMIDGFSMCLVSTMHHNRLLRSSLNFINERKMRKVLSMRLNCPVWKWSVVQEECVHFHSGQAKNRDIMWRRTRHGWLESATIKLINWSLESAQVDADGIFLSFLLAGFLIALAGFVQYVCERDEKKTETRETLFLPGEKINLFRFIRHFLIQYQAMQWSEITRGEKQVFPMLFLWLLWVSLPMRLRDWFA